MPGFSPPVVFPKLLLEAFARLYNHIIPELTVLVDEQRTKKRYFDVTMQMKNRVIIMYKNAITFYDTKDAAGGYITAGGKLFNSTDNTTIRNIIKLHRLALRVPSADGSALNLTTSMGSDFVTRESNQISGTEVEHCTSAAKFIGMGVASGEVRLVTCYKIDGFPSHFQLNPSIPFCSAIVRPIIADRKQDRKDASGDATAKRAGGVQGMAAGAASVYLAMINLMKSMGDGKIDDEKYAHKGKQLFRKAQVLLFVVISMTSPARGRETLMATFDDFTERVQGNEEFMIMMRCLLVDPCALPRTKFYRMRRLHAKHLNTLERYMQQALPEYASALSIPDVMCFCMTVMIRLQHKNLLSPRCNPFMHIFLGTGDGKVDRVEAEAEDEVDRVFDNQVDEIAEKDEEVVAARALAKSHNIPIPSGSGSKRKATPFGVGNLEMARMDTQLKQDVPPCCVRKSFISGYSSRTGIAILLEKLDIMDETEDKQLRDFVRMWYGHSMKSWQVLLYAETTARFRVCNQCVDDVDSKGCWCFRLRDPKKKKA